MKNRLDRVNESIKRELGALVRRDRSIATNHEAVVHDISTLVRGDEEPTRVRREITGSVKGITDWTRKRHFALNTGIGVKHERMPNLPNSVGPQTKLRSCPEQRLSRNTPAKKPLAELPIAKDSP